MTVDELKSLLETVSTVMRTGVEKYPADLADTVGAYLETMPEQNVLVLAALLKMSAEEVKTNVEKVKQVIESLDLLFASGKAAEIAAFAERLSDRPLLLKMLAWQLG